MIEVTACLEARTSLGRRIRGFDLDREAADEWAADPANLAAWPGFEIVRVEQRTTTTVLFKAGAKRRQQGVA